MNEDQLSMLVTDILQQRSLELDSLDFIPTGKRLLVRITVDGDGPTGTGPALDEITAAAREISKTLDKVNFSATTPYNLEVGSRGVSKPLTQPKHYRRNIGRLLKVKLTDGSFIGRITAADDQTVTLKADNNKRVIDFADIRKAVVQVELNRPAPDPSDVEEN